MHEYSMIMDHRIGDAYEGDEGWDTAIKTAMFCPECAHGQPRLQSVAGHGRAEPGWAVESTMRRLGWQQLSHFESPSDRAQQSPLRLDHPAQSQQTLRTSDMKRAIRSELEDRISMSNRRKFKVEGQGSLCALNDCSQCDFSLLPVSYVLYGLPGVLIGMQENP